MKDRVNFVKDKNRSKGGFDKLPNDALEALEKVMDELNQFTKNN
jgi:phosphoenolpyruvate carboxykinase (ATP)